MLDKKCMSSRDGDGIVDAIRQSQMKDTMPNERISIQSSSNFQLCSRAMKDFLYRIVPVSKQLLEAFTTNPR